MIKSGLLDIPAQMRELYAQAKEDHNGGWRAVGDVIGVSGAYARLIAYKQRPLTPVIAARWMGTVDIEETQRVAVCPSCLAHGLREVHAAGDCHGRPIAQVVTLAPGEQVRHAPRRPQYPDGFDRPVTPAPHAGPRCYTKAGRLVGAGWQEYA